MKGEKRRTRKANIALVTTNGKVFTPLTQAETPKTEEKDGWHEFIGWYKWVLLFISILLIGSYAVSILNTQSEKYYEAHLTPQERADLAAQRLADQQKAGANSAAFWGNIFGLLSNPVLLWIAIVYLYTRQNRHFF